MPALCGDEGGGELNIYVASSWRNPTQQEVVKRLREAGHEVYDFRNPEPGNTGFHWSEIDPDWKQWTPEKFREALEHDIAVDGFSRDFQAMIEAAAGVLVMPCGRSAHIEAGYFAGQHKALFILLSDGEPELMYAMADRLCTSVDELLEALVNTPGVCRVCGCTDLRACAGGCDWINAEHTLCSACAGGGDEQE